MPTGSDMFRDRPCLISRERIVACLTKLPPDIWPSCWRYWTLARPAYPPPHAAALLARSRPNVNGLIAGRGDRHIVLDDDHGVPGLYQSIELLHKLWHVCRGRPVAEHGGDACDEPGNVSS
jgi:hypothetical protein